MLLIRRNSCDARYGTKTNSEKQPSMKMIVMCRLCIREIWTKIRRHSSSQPPLSRRPHSPAPTNRCLSHCVLLFLTSDHYQSRANQINIQTQFDLIERQSVVCSLHLNFPFHSVRCFMAEDWWFRDVENVNGTVCIVVSIDAKSFLLFVRQWI